ncbi:MAG: hypothetical protein Q4E28_01245 [Clostridia bacterium]|nr:hypothetical protein [Clostridia bacterium]
MSFLDISVDFFEENDNEITARIQKFFQIENGDEFNQTALYTGLQNATHILTPSFCFENEKTIADYDLSTFIGPCEVIELKEPYITGDLINRYFSKFAKKLLIKSTQNIEFMPGAADDLAFCGYELIGFDKNINLEIDKINTHRALMRDGCVLLKNLDLSEVESGEYFLFSSVLKLGKTEASPTRAILFTEYINWPPRKDEPLYF